MHQYEYIDSFKKSFDDRLPDRCEFRNSLKDECIDKKDYLHTIDVWIVFKMKTMRSYHCLCLRTDVLLLPDVFEKSIETCLEYYRLDPSNYKITTLGLSWDAMLKMTKIELELISDIDM